MPRSSIVAPAMIISASRRTDLPALYSPWLLNRLRAGYVLVRHPYNPRRVSRIALDPSVVDCLVLWSKNPAPLVPHLQEITSLGYPVVLHYTLTACDQTLEPCLPDLAERIATFHALSRQLGPDQIIWRFDPIVLTRSLDADHWLREFIHIARQMQGYTRHCIISFVSLYAKCIRNLRGIDLLPPDDTIKKKLAQHLLEQAQAHGMRLTACCDTFLHEQCAIEQAHCIDAVQLSRILACSLKAGKDPGQRPGCGCMVSIDIGAYDSCPHGCRYCYANTSPQRAARHFAAHDPASPLLIGTLQGNDIITERAMASFRSPQLRFCKENNLLAPLF